MPDKNNFLFEPNIRIYGKIESATVLGFLDQLEKVRQTDKPVVFEITTEGGDPEAERRIAMEIRLCRRWHGWETYFVGKTIVYSAGIVIMSAFPRECRYLTDDTELLIHERRTQESLTLEGPMRSNIQILREKLTLVETSQQIDIDGFMDLAVGSKISGEELTRRAQENLYLRAKEALELGLIADVI